MSGERLSSRAHRGLQAHSRLTRRPAELYKHLNQAAVRLWWEKLSAYPDWKGEYWSNTGLSGTPNFTRNDVVLDFNWAQAAPQPGFAADNFSARWTRTLGLEAGTYRFHVLVDDGARLWVDDRLLIDEWRGGASRELTSDYAISAGDHKLRVEYVEFGAEARLKVWWEKVGAASYPDWRGDYWSNPGLSGAPVLSRNDARINFAWGRAAPAPSLPVDSFSVRWSRTLSFEPGVYRFSASADDGIRVYLDGALLINEWHEGQHDRIYDRDVSLAGTHLVVIEYFENSWDALVDFWWKRLGDLPTATGTATSSATFTPTHLPPTATSTLSASATPSNTPTRTPTQLPTATPSWTPTSTQSATPTATATVTQAPASTATSSATPVPTVSPPSGRIRGRVWLDQCPFTGPADATPAPLPEGCIETFSGAYQANGQLDRNESGLANVQVLLNPGPCPTHPETAPAQPVATSPFSATTNAEGVFGFSDLLPGSYCVLVDPQAAPQPAPIPTWLVDQPATTLPASPAWITVKITEHLRSQAALFGWDPMDILEDDILLDAAGHALPLQFGDPPNQRPNSNH